jgi:asparagine synthase (glutamine-hydrolysing)
MGCAEAAAAIVRDRLGVKPVYYSLLASGLVFGSEIKALLEDPDVPRLERRIAQARASRSVNALPSDDLRRGSSSSPPRII